MLADFLMYERKPKCPEVFDHEFQLGWKAFGVDKRPTLMAQDMLVAGEIKMQSRETSEDYT